MQIHAVNCNQLGLPAPTIENTWGFPWGSPKCMSYHGKCPDKMEHVSKTSSVRNLYWSVGLIRIYVWRFLNHLLHIEKMDDDLGYPHLRKPPFEDNNQLWSAACKDGLGPVAPPAAATAATAPTAAAASWGCRSGNQELVRVQNDSCIYVIRHIIILCIYCMLCIYIYI